MALPPRVQADLEAADALQANYQQARSESTANAVQDVATLESPQAPATTPQESPPPQPAPQPPAPAPAPKDDFEHKYRVLQGMYAADVTAMRKQFQAQSEQMTAMAAQLAALSAPKPESQSVSQTVEKDIETFGADLIAMVQRYAEGQAATINARLDALEAQIGGVTQSVAVSAEEAFFKSLEALCPTYREINVDPQWLAWLGVRDDVYGLPRQAALDDARQKLDAQRAANVFNAFLKSKPVPESPPSLDNQQAPSTAGNPAPLTEPSKPILSEKSIIDFYKDVGRGAYVGREAEQARLEAIINSAVAEGRVR